jgi:hypothetical protein
VKWSKLLFLFLSVQLNAEYLHLTIPPVFRNHRSKFQFHAFYQSPLCNRISSSLSGTCLPDSRHSPGMNMPLTPWMKTIALVCMMKKRQRIPVFQFCRRICHMQAFVSPGYYYLSSIFFKASEQNSLVSSSRALSNDSVCAL